MGGEKEEKKREKEAMDNEFQKGKVWKRRGKEGRSGGEKDRRREEEER